MSDTPANPNQSDESQANIATEKYKPLRTWPAAVLVVSIVALAIAFQFVPNMLEDDLMVVLMVLMMGPAIFGLMIILWWLLFSRATWLERIVGFVGIVVVAAAALALSDKSMLGPGIIMLTIPMGMAGFGIGAILCRRSLSFKRTWVAILVAALGFSYTTLLRSTGVWGTAGLDSTWRWETSAEDNMLAKRDALPKANIAEISESDLDSWLANPQWPQFRGPGGLSQQHGPKINDDWSSNAPELIWKIKVGPGWSSFAVAGNLLFTQEQHGANETVVCYAADSGKEIWSQQIESRFFDPMGGPGPRATPTLANGMLFVQGANGQIQRLDPKSGEVVWSKDLRDIADREPPTWGFSSSPLVTGPVVIVHAGGAGDKGTLAFDVETGELKWSAAAGDHSYSSAQLCSLDGTEYVFMLTNDGMNVLDPQSGQQLLDYNWEMSGYRALQPQVIEGNSVLLPTGIGTGTRRIKITKSDTGLAAEEEWTSLQLEPDFNDFVVHKNHAYGYDNSVFTCIDLATGETKWKGGRYGKGQVLLLADSDLLLVMAEKGDVVLLAADPAGHKELAKFKAIQGRTWNHPVVIGDRLYVRNSEEAACYRLPLAIKTVSTDAQSLDAQASTEVSETSEQ